MSQFCEVRGTGNTGTDPELRVLPSGTTVVNLRVCIHRRWLDGKEWRASETWLNLVFENSLADEALKILKGSEIYFEGSASERDIDARRRVFEIRVRRWHGIGKATPDNPKTDYFF